MTPSDKRAELERTVIKLLYPGVEDDFYFVDFDMVYRVADWHEQEIAEALETLRHNLEADLYGHDYERLVDEINNIMALRTKAKEDTK